MNLRVEQSNLLQKAKDQEHFFKTYSVVDGTTCDNKSQKIYYGLDANNDNILCGIAQITIKTNSWYINYLITRGVNDKKYICIGTRLLDEIVKDARNDKNIYFIYLTNGIKNPIKKAFYRNYGFTQPYNDSTCFLNTKGPEFLYNNLHLFNKNEFKLHPDWLKYFPLDLFRRF